MMYHSGEQPKSGDIVVPVQAGGSRLMRLLFARSQRFEVKEIDFYQFHPTPMVHVVSVDYQWQTIPKWTRPSHWILLLRRAEEKPTWMVDVDEEFARVNNRTLSSGIDILIQCAGELSEMKKGAVTE